MTCRVVVSPDGTGAARPQPVVRTGWSTTPAAAAGAAKAVVRAQAAANAAAHRGRGPGTRSSLIGSGAWPASPRDAGPTYIAFIKCTTGCASGLSVCFGWFGPLGTPPRKGLEVTSL